VSPFSIGKQQPTPNLALRDDRKGINLGRIAAASQGTNILPRNRAELVTTGAAKGARSHRTQASGGSSNRTEWSSAGTVKNREKLIDGRKRPRFLEMYFAKSLI
jgi:hypothetical protein